MIELITGRPATGKTLFAYQRVSEGTAEGLSCFLVDDAHQLWPAHQPDVYFVEPATGRPLSQLGGVLFVLVAQHPRQLPATLLGLVQRHYHMHRDVGGDVSRIFVFDRYTHTPEVTVPLAPGRPFRLRPLQIQA